MPKHHWQYISVLENSDAAQYEVPHSWHTFKVDVMCLPSGYQVPHLAAPAHHQQVYIKLLSVVRIGFTVIFYAFKIALSRSSSSDWGNLAAHSPGMTKVSHSALNKSERWCQLMLTLVSRQERQLLTDSKCDSIFQNHHTNTGPKVRVQCSDLHAPLSAAQTQSTHVYLVQGLKSPCQEDSASKSLEGKDSCHQVKLSSRQMAFKPSCKNIGCPGSLLLCNSQVD